MKFYYKNNIILYHLPSHTSYKLQPCDVGIFRPLKAVYYKEVERLYQEGSNMIGKQHFTLLYNCTRRKAITLRNITSRWLKTGLHLFNLDRALKEIQKLEITLDKRSYKPLTIETSGSNQEFHEL
jgi:hypothetical protein